MSLRNLQGAVEALHAAAQTGKTDGLEDVANQLSQDYGTAYEDIANGIEGELQKLVEDDEVDNGKLQGLRNLVDTYRNELGKFEPRIGQDPRRPNPITQPGDPNIVAESQPGDMPDSSSVSGGDGE